jgi:adiponectin receptor
MKISASAVGCIFATLHPRFMGPAFRPYRAILYASLGLFGLVFVSDGLLRYGFDVRRKRFAMGWLSLMAALNLLGAIFYALRVTSICPF